MRWSALAAAAAAVVIPAVASGGPNAGGVLCVHTVEGSTYTSGVESDCGRSQVGCPGDPDCPYTPDCSNDPARFDPTSDKPAGETALFWIVAVFPLDTPGWCPSLLGANFKIDYQASDGTAPGLVVVAQDHCADFELATEDWPAPGSNTSILFHWPQRSPVVELYWFAAYAARTGDPATEAQQLRLLADPGQHRGEFVNESVPGLLDPIEGFGVMGFGGAEGWNPPKPRAPHFADLAIVDHEIAPAIPVPGEDVRVRIRVGNLGTMETPPTEVDVVLNAKWRGLAALRPVGPADSAWTAWLDLGPLRDGRHLLEICADAGDRVRETAEENCRTAVFAIGAGDLPDLHVEVTRSSFTPTASGDSVRVHAVVSNRGLVASSPSVVTVRLDGVEVCRVAVPIVRAGGRVPLSLCTLPFEPGASQIVEICADADDEVEESDEAPNCQRLTLDPNDHSLPRRYK